MCMVDLISLEKMSHFKNKRNLATLDPSLVHVGFVVRVVVLGEVFLSVSPFPLSVLFHHCSVFIFSTTDAI